MDVPWSLRLAAVLSWLVAAGFGLPVFPVVKGLLAGRDLPVIFGFRAFGNGPFESLGARGMVALLVAFFIVCVADAVAGVLMWNGHRTGAIASLVLVPVAGIFWWGFQLPYPPVTAVVRVTLILVGWGSLK